MINGSPVFQMISAMNNDQDPMQVLMRMSDPRAAQAMTLLGRGNNARTIAINMAKEQGVDLGALAQSLGLTLPK